MTMNKVKSPLVKVLRKAGYSVKEAMNITLDAQYNYANESPYSSKNFNKLAKEGRIGGMFNWRQTTEGLKYWHAVQLKINPNW